MNITMHAKLLSTIAELLHYMLHLKCLACVIEQVFLECVV